MSDIPEPRQLSGHVRALERAGAYHVLTMSVPGFPQHPRPGQFVALAVGGHPSAMLGRRAFSLYEVMDEGDGGPPTVRVVFAVHGAGTAWLAALRPGDGLDVVGPLGQPFTLPAPGTRCVLVGGGYGSAPLYALADRLRQHGCPVDFVLGAATAGRVFGVERAREVSASVAVTTVDGSLGERGVVTDALLPLLAREGSGDSKGTAGCAVYACGPMPMLRAVTGIAAGRGVPVQVAVEESMACGIGVCMTCVLPVVDGDGATRMTRSCLAGPVFSGTALRWEHIDSGAGVPDDAVGARA